MVHFTQFRFCTLFYSGIQMLESLPAGYPIRLSAAHWICASPRSFSQLITTFFALQLHRHPPWTYIRLTILSFPSCSLLFHYSSSFNLCQADDFPSLPAVCYLHLSFRSLNLHDSCFFPSLILFKDHFNQNFWFRLIMEQDRVELSTPALSERCSNQLSYCSRLIYIKLDGK